MSLHTQVVKKREAGQDTPALAKIVRLGTQKSAFFMPILGKEEKRRGVV